MIKKNIYKELKSHAPFTAFGVLTGIIIMLIIIFAEVPRSMSIKFFWGLHPLHVLFSAMATTAMYRIHGKSSIITAILVGYFGSIGIATLSDSIIPYIGELLLGLPNKHIHLGFIEKWWLVNPLALAGVAIAYFWPNTKLPHTGHVLLSTWASLFHMSMALGANTDTLTLILVPIFLFLAVLIPCCTSDIIFPLLFVKE